MKLYIVIVSEFPGLAAIVTNLYSFAANNGVKEEVLSPVLFCIYVDQLLTRLMHAGVSCYIGSDFVGALTYANDIVLVAPSPTLWLCVKQICIS